MIALNPDLIERVEATPDTVVTLVDEKKFLIEESLEDVLRLITDYRAFIIARARDISVTDYDPTGRPVLHVVPNELVTTPTMVSGHGDPEEAMGVVHTIESAIGRSDDSDRDDLGGRYS